MASESAYWSRFWRRELSRRRFLQATGVGAAGVAAAGIVGCNGDDEDVEPTPVNGVTPTPDDDEPQVGGTWRGPLVGLSTGNPPTLDAMRELSFLAQIPAAYHYSRLLKAIPPEPEEIDGVPSVPIDFSNIEGDGAEGMPEIVDEVTFNFTLRDNLNFHDVSPVDGRTVTAEDVAASMEMFAAESPNRGNWLTFVEGVEVTGEKTLTVTLRQPFGPALQILFGNNDGGPWIYPTEVIDDQSLADRRPIGSGPFIFQDWEDGSEIRWRRNPDWYDSPRPYIEEIHSALIADPEVILANLSEGRFDGSLWTAQLWDSARNTLPPDMQWFTGPEHVWGGAYFNFAVQPFNDVRVRQALSLSIDRPGILAALDEPGAVGGGGGLTHVSQYAGFYIDPINDADTFGPNAQYYQRDVERATQLLAEAGYPNGLDVTGVTSIIYGPGFGAMMEAFGASAGDAGFRFEFDRQEYGAYISTTYFGELGQNQMGLAPLMGSPMDPHNLFFRVMHPTSAIHNYGPRRDPHAIPAEDLPLPDDPSPAGDGNLLQLWSQQAAETDLEARTELIHEIQREMAETMYFVPWTGVSTAYVYHPYVRNIRLIRGYAFGAETLPHMWLAT